MAVEASLHLVSEAAVLARLGRVVLDSVKLDKLEWVAKRAAATIADGGAALDFNNRYLRNAKFSVAAVAVDVLFMQKPHRQTSR